MPEKMVCPGCRSDLRVRGAKNPITCETCQSDFNLVTYTASIRLEFSAEDREKVDTLLHEYHIAGDYFLNSFKARFDNLRKTKNWEIITKKDQEFECFGCQKPIGKRVQTCIQINGHPLCYACGIDDICGKTAKAQLYPKTTDGFDSLKEKLGIQMPYKTFLSLAYDDAQDFFSRWLSDNWGILIRRKEFEAELKICKDKNRNFCEPSENWEITKVRDDWRKILTPMSPLWFFQLYYTGRRLSKGKNRRKRRERIKKLGKITDIAYAISKPICEDCEHLEKYEWGWECELDAKLGMRKQPSGTWPEAKLGRLPEFPRTRVKLFKDFYEIDLKTGKAKLKLWSWPGEQAEIPETEWLDKQYGRENLTDASRFPALYRSGREKVSSRESRKIYCKDPALQPYSSEPTLEKPYYLLYPLSRLIPVKSGNWEHIITYGPVKTCVLSIANSQQKVKFFKHGDIVSFKEYFASQRKEAQKRRDEKEKAAEEAGMSMKRFTFWDIPRDKELHKTKAVLHNEARRIADYLAEMPGQVTILNMKKSKLGRGIDEKKELNRQLSFWADSNFRPLMFYKLELAGLVATEKEFRVAEVAEKEQGQDKGGLAICPYCHREVGGSWQNLVVFEWQKNIVCECGKQSNVLLAIALNFFQTEDCQT